MKKHLVLVLTVLVAVAVLLSGCGKTGQDQSVSEKKTDVRIAYFPNINHAQALIGKDQKLFENEMGKSANISYKQFNSGTSEIEAFFAKELDLGYIGPGPAINGFIKSKGDLVVLAGAANGGSMLVARSGLAITDIKQLSGKTIGVPNFGNTQDLMLRNLLAESGLKDTTQGGTVKIIQVENPDVKGLFDQKQLDLALVPEPWGTILVDEAKAEIVRDEKALWRNGDYPTTVIIARKDFVENHPDLTEAFLRAHVKATTLINDDNEKAGEYINRQIEEATGKKLSDNVLQHAFSRIVFTQNTNINAIEEFADIMKKLEIIPKDSNVNGIYDKTTLDKVLQ